MNDKAETHSLSCPFCNKNFKARGKMPMEIGCPHCRTLLNVKSPWNIHRGTRRKLTRTNSSLSQ
jgi:phage FluMu protein Com